MGCGLGFQRYSGGLLGSCLIICDVMEKLQSPTGNADDSFCIIFITVASIAAFHSVVT